jgi:hypothetical protein
MPGPQPAILALVVSAGLAACAPGPSSSGSTDAGATGYDLFQASGASIGQSVLVADDARTTGLTTVAPLKTVAPLQQAAGLATVAPWRIAAVGDRFDLDEQVEDREGVFARRSHHRRCEVLSEVGRKKIALLTDHALLDDEGAAVEEGTETQTLEWSSVPASLSCGIALVRELTRSSLRPTGTYRIAGEQILTATEDIRGIEVEAPDADGATSSTTVKIGALYPGGAPGTGGKQYAPWLRVADRNAVAATPRVQSLSILRETARGERLVADIVTRWDASGSVRLRQRGERDFVKFEFDRGSQGKLSVSGTLLGFRGAAGFVVDGGTLVLRLLAGDGQELRTLTLDSFRPTVGRTVAIRGTWKDARDGRTGTYSGEARPGERQWTGKLVRGNQSQTLDLSAWIPLVF